jgi:uncharacterized membrane-anchored protein
MTTDHTTDEAIDLRKTQELPPQETAPTKTAPYAPMRKKFIGAIILQLGVLATMFSMPAYTVATGETVFLKTRLYDPWDMFRGQYITLKFDGASAVPSPPGLVWGQTVYVALRKGGEFATAEKVYSSMPNVDRKQFAVMRAKVKQVGEGCVDVTYGIERYYIPERTGDRFSDARGPLLAEVAVDNFGNCVLKKVVPGDKK